MSDDYEVYLSEQLKDPEFKAEWDALEPEYQIVRAMLQARKEEVD